MSTEFYKKIKEEGETCNDPKMHGCELPKKHECKEWKNHILTQIGPVNVYQSILGIEHFFTVKCKKCNNEWNINRFYEYSDMEIGRAHV